MKTYYWTFPLAAVCGALLSLPFTGGSSLPVWFALAPVFYAVALVPGRRHALGCAALFAGTWMLLGLRFIAVQTVWGALGASLYSASFYVAALLGVRMLARRGIFSAVFGTAALWGLAEIARSRIPVLGFPWLLLGHATVRYPFLRQNADLLGVYGLSFLIAALNAALAFAAPAFVTGRISAPRGGPGRRRLCAAGVLTLLGAALIYGRARVAELASRLEAGPELALIQGSVYQKVQRSEEEKERQLASHLKLHAQAVQEAPPGRKPALVCWAETMVPGVYNRDDYRLAFEQTVRRFGVPTLFGSDGMNENDKELEDLAEQRWYNCAFVLDGRGRMIARYAKRRLVPFGEYVPFKRAFPFLKALGSVTRDTYTPGLQPSPLVDLGTFRFCVNVCVEDVHPELAREAAFLGAEAILNITNDAWFAGSSGAAAHLQAARLRAVEVRRPLVRVTNSGYTVQVDPLGRCELLLAPDTVGIGRTRLKRLRGGAPGTLSMMLGEGWAALFFALVLAGGWFLDREGSRNMLNKNTL